MKSAPPMDSLNYRWLARSLEAMPAMLRALELKAPPDTPEITPTKMDETASAIEQVVKCLRFMAGREA